MKAQGSVILIILLLLTACYSGQRREMLALLDEADSLNRAYAQLPSDTLLRRAADFFDRHGTVNDRVRAHYLLGCAYRDMGQAPEALQAWQDAIDRADTTARDCDFQRLMAVYGQMAELYDDQGLAADEMSAALSYEKYALQIGDTFKYIHVQELKSKVYDLLGDTTQMLNQMEIARSLYERNGYYREAVQTLIVPIFVAIDRGQLDSARLMMYDFDRYSGLFNSDGFIEEGREVYYYLKGLYHYKKESYDSAEIYARRALLHGETVNGYRLLLDIYRVKCQPESLSHFAGLFEKALDAESRASENEIIHCMSSLYDYHKSEHRAAVKTIEAMRLKSMLTILLVFIAFLIVLAAGFILRIRKKHHDAVKHYLKNVTQLRKAREEILILKHSADGFQKVLKEKEDSLARLESLVNEYQNKNLQNLSYNESESSLEGTEVYNHFHVLANKGIKPTSEDWLALDDLMREKHCAFYDLMLRKKTILKEFEYAVCLLIHINIKPTPISRMYGVSGPYLSQVRRDLLKKMFNIIGKPSDFDDTICKITT